MVYIKASDLYQVKSVIIEADREIHEVNSDFSKIDIRRDGKPLSLKLKLEDLYRNRGPRYVTPLRRS
jgi:hypothetical protein